MSDEEEYEIESVTEARVEIEKRRKRWEFRVRWKGYEPEDDTWEPIENLAGSEETLERFLQRMNTGGRDYRNLALFKLGEHFIPVGPPRRPRVKEKAKEYTPDLDLPSSSRTRKRDSDDNGTSEDRHSSKRLRPTLQTFSSKPNLLLTEAGSPFKSTPADNSTFNSRQPCSSSTNDSTERPPGSMADLLNFSEDTPVSQSMPVGSVKAGAGAKAETSVPTPSSTKVVKSTMPLHRARAANPLVKALFDQGITLAKSSSAPKRKKPGPGRSSDGLMIRRPTLLTAEKGKLKSLKGKRKAENHTREFSNGEENVSGLVLDEDIFVEPPRPGELLHLAGLGPETTDLPGFEYDNTEVAPPNQVTTDTHPAGDSLPPAVRESLLPTIASEVASHPEWKRPTIFGLLGLGADTSRSEPHISPDQSSIPFQITLDSTTSLPVLFVDHILASTFSTSELIRSGPPGKFYRGSHATNLLGTLRTKSFFARAVLSPEATESHTTNFEHFSKRLRNDELFVEMIGRDLLAFCSSNNAFFTQRLNIVPGLLSVNAILAAHVSIENQSTFADVVTSADDTIWSQYVSNTVAV